MKKSENPETKKKGLNLNEKKSPAFVRRITKKQYETETAKQPVLLEGKFLRSYEDTEKVFKQFLLIGDELYFYSVTLLFFI